MEPGRMLKSAAHRAFERAREAEERRLKEKLKQKESCVPMDVAERVEALRALAADAGRDPDSIEITIFGAPRSEGTLERYAEARVSRVVFGLPPVPRDLVLPALDRRTDILSRVR